MSTSDRANPFPGRFKVTVSRFTAALAATFTVLLLVSAVAQAQLAAPRLQSPSNRSTVQALPAFTWRSVGRAASYQFEFSANRNFSSGVSGFGVGPVGLDTTAITDDQTIPNGSYFWRVRAMSATNVPGRWSPMRRLTKRWSTKPKLLSPVNTTIDWPSSPVLLKWTTVPHAVNYAIEIGTSPALSHLVYGPTQVQGPEYAFPSVLAPSTYYWAVQPVDAAGQLGVRSAVHQFTWAWPSNTTLTESDVSPDSTYEEPSFSWTPIAGASSYELEVSTDPSYPTNAIILDSTGLISTSYTPQSFFPNHTTLYWRLRARDVNGDAGSWNDGQSFTETFDQTTPSVTNLHVVDQYGAVQDGNPTPTSEPIVRWTPVPGASDYTVTFIPWSAGTGCNVNGTVSSTTTPLTSWTEGYKAGEATWEGVYGWPGTAAAGADLQLSPGSYCVSVLASRHDAPLEGSTITSIPTFDGSSSQPAFTYQLPTVSGTLATDATVTYSPGIVPPAYGSAALPAGSTVSTAPLFEWQPVAGATGYYVIIANDEEFDPNSIVLGAYTNLNTAWAPPAWLQDQTGTLWWEVIPVDASEGNGEPLMDPEGGAYDPQPFTKNSTAPQPVSPIGGANVPTQPVFSWDSAQGAANYTLEISADPSFANPIVTASTDSTSFTSGTTLPPGETLYWRVRANDPGYNFNWSGVQTFTHNLPAPQTLPISPTGGSTIPLLVWSAVSGASTYNMRITNSGSTSTLSTDTPYVTPSEFWGPGISDWQVQSVFPGGATSAYSNPQASYRRAIPAPRGIRATKSGSRILVSWNADPIAKAYVIQLSTTTGFGSPIASATTDNTAWVPQISGAEAAQRLYWRLAVVDHAGNVGAYHIGVFKGPHANKAKGKAKGKGKGKSKGKPKHKH